MNTQKGFSSLLGLALFIVLIGAGLFLYTEKVSREIPEIITIPVTTQKIDTEAPITPNPSEVATQAILNGNYYDPKEDMSFLFADGKYFYKNMPGKGDTMQATDYPDSMYAIDILKDHIALGKIVNSAVESAAMITGTRFGGPGYFYELVILKNTSEHPDTKPIFQAIDKISLGDRQTILSLKIEDDLVKIEYITQGEGEGLCCGTKRMSRTFRITYGKVTEITQ